ncbi:helix-turn-helix transcriptional regulator [Lentzea sp. BCCO 10_0798]|uniref:Helix-turn-helix transcriptional regulator n=1 Tax=Lentzea kristufekii TaxID=3095430 RepID=A0ABU4TSQ2_9PSEU|nr:helix-turn-helix transcriptional regulator [Lentzea sp. BCCO 10_0798]MDX8051242.1 helix-turn-helix transcriptional regulator [Lentzea sp. BCCO 10_0798]
MTQGPSDFKKSLGKRLGELMERAGVEKSEVAEMLDCSVSKVFRIVSGGVGVNPSELDRLLDFLGVEAKEREELKLLGKEAKKRRPPTPWGSAVPDSLRKYFGTEESASLIRAYDPETVNGLAQTETYMRSMIEASPLHRPGDVPRLVQARMARKHLLDKRLTGEHPPRLHLLLSEGAVRREVGGAGAMRDQLCHLIELSGGKRGGGKRRGDSGPVVVQVVPFAAGAHAACGLPFTLFTRPDGQVVAYNENLTDGLFVSEAGRIESYELTWQSLLNSALSPQKSVELLDTVATQL